MAYIEIIPPGRATEETAEAYNLAVRVTQSRLIPKIVQIFSLRPATMRMMIRKFELTMWSGNVPRQFRELVAAAVSRCNNCHY
ncbi:MAG: carboxymuconolactone decarboxylase family protein [Desulfobacterales bacterium]|jgi:hypothetical protein